MWAFWSGAAGAADASVVGLLNDAAKAGRANTDAVADAYCAHDAERQVIAREYLRKNMRFALDAPAIEGLKTFYREATALGLVAGRPLEWFPS